jgi:hypothetical protein
MCARRFLIAIFFLTLLTVAAGFALFRWGGEILVKQAVPKGHYAPPTKDTAPDYAKTASWAARPDVANDPSSWHPDGMPADMDASGPAAVFYIHPTTYLKTDRWNGPIDNSDSLNRTNLFVKSEASAFAGAGKVWAPLYRQAAYGAFLLKNDDATKALDLAYSDVSRAFDEFLKQVPATQPIILAGHSQGSLHLLRLLVDRKEALKGRLVAAYVVGWPVSVTADLSALGIPACTKPDETGCLLSWMSFGDPPDAGMMLDEWQSSPSPTGKPRRAGDVLCVNPLTGTRDGSAPPAANSGTLLPSADLQSAKLEPGRVGARCANGLLIVGGDVPAFIPPPLLGNNFHVYDYALFWGSIRKDAAMRVAAFEAQ